MKTAHDRTLAAAGCILVYALIIGFTDNYVRVIAESAGLWQFHATRSAMALAVLAGAAAVMGWRLRPRNWRGVIGRSAIHGSGMVIYFGALAFLPVAQVAAGLFTAPIFVLLISRLVYGHVIGPVRIAAVGLGFLGVMLVLGPQALSGTSAAALLPVVAGAFYAMGNIATREWCAGESAQTMLAGFFAALGLYGLLGMAVLGLFPQEVPQGAAGFVLRGPAVPQAGFWIWTAVQAVGSLIGVGLMIRGYQLTEAGRASVFEYVILPASALWGFILWGERLTPVAMLGMAMIAAAGIMIALRARQQEV
ncbi:MAG: DMT family transporter [Paracoccaceae bacterium]